VGAPILPFHLWGPPLPGDVKFCYKILETPSYHMVKTRNLYLTCCPNGTRFDGQTDRQT